MTKPSTPPTDRLRIWAYREVGKTVEMCPYGCEHDVAYVEVKRLTETGLTREHDNGYAKQQTALLLDAQGRTYHRHEPIDYYGSTLYVRDGDHAPFRSSPPLGPVRDLNGRPVGSNGPAGPAWSPSLPQPRSRTGRRRRG